MLSANSKSFTFLFQSGLPLNYFSLLITVAKNPKLILNSGSQSGHPCLVPKFRGNAFKLSPLKIKLAVGLSQMAFIMLRCVPSISVF